jgi:hypothetical protein
MNDQNDGASDHSEVVKLMRQARDKSRGYSEFWEWKLDKRQAELQAAQVSYSELLAAPSARCSNDHDRWSSSWD